MTNLELSNDILTDSNCWHRRLYRCWIDGSYLGQGHYQENCERVRQNYNNDRALRGEAIGQWLDFMASEFSCSRDTVRRQMVSFFTRDELERLNTELVDDLRDLVREQMDSEA